MSDDESEVSKDLYFEEAQESIWEFIRHGSPEHQHWLREAIRAWFEGKERPPEYGNEDDVSS